MSFSCFYNYLIIIMFSFFCAVHSNTTAPAVPVTAKCNPTAIILVPTVFKPPSTLQYMKLTKALLDAPKPVWLSNIISWCRLDYCNVVAVARSLLPFHQDTNDIFYQPGLISMYDPLLLKVWFFHRSEEKGGPVRCGTDVAYIAASGVQ